MRLDLGPTLHIRTLNGPNPFIRGPHLACSHWPDHALGARAAPMVRLRQPIENPAASARLKPSALVRYDHCAQDCHLSKVGAGDHRAKRGNAGEVTADSCALTFRKSDCEPLSSLLRHLTGLPASFLGLAQWTRRRYMPSRTPGVVEGSDGDTTSPAPLEKSMA